ncbi:MAG: hypothetical protein N3A57_02320 [Negativicutes bacterium]|nr:hypothetical protein [Negativicutes bacterium]
MRGTNQIYQNNFLFDLNKNNNRLVELQQQVGTGKIAQRPSDAPTIVARSLTFSVQLNQTDMNDQNINSGIGWLDASDNAIQTVNSMLIHIQEKVTQALNGTYNDADIQAIGTDIAKMTQQIINTMNTNVGDRFLFAGTRDSLPPFDSNGVYAGDQGKIYMPVQGGVVNPADPVNVSGTDVMGPLQFTTINVNGNNVSVDSSLQGDGKTPQTLYLLNKLSQLMINNPGQFKNPATAENSWLRNNAVNITQAAMGITKNCLAEIGAIGDAYRMSLKMNYNTNMVIQQQDSLNSDVDASQAIIYLKSVETTYQASMAVGARLMPNSLVDYLK